MDHGARRGCGAAVPEPGAGEAMALREEEEGGEGNGGDKPVAANLRVVRGLLVLADSPPPRRRRAHAVVAEAAGLRPHPYAAQAKPCLIARPVARGHGPANTVLPVAPRPAHGLPPAAAGTTRRRSEEVRGGSTGAGELWGSDLTPHAGFPGTPPWPEKNWVHPGRTGASVRP